MAAEYLTAKALAARWDCDASFVRRLCRRGLLRAMRLGSDWRISQEAVSEYEARNTTAAADHVSAAPQPASQPARVSAPASLIELDGALPERWWERETTTAAASSAAGRSRSAANKKRAVSGGHA